jgi:drug/metabolite transporter (DMT)-like permease
MRRYLLGFVLLAFVDTSAHVLFKIAAVQTAPLRADYDWLARVVTHPATLGAIACYAATFFLWISILRRAPVGPAFAASHVDVVTVMVASAALLHERVSFAQVGGAALILCGIACLSIDATRGSSAEPR